LRKKKLMRQSDKLRKKEKRPRQLRENLLRLRLVTRKKQRSKSFKR
jgi:hypothetical protein